jgi:hypothetical protein
VANRTGHWQVRFTNIGDLFSIPALVSKAKTHLAMTVDTELTGVAGSERSLSRVRLYLNGKEVLPASDLVSYSPPVGGALRIGVTALSAVPYHPIRPIISQIQEMVLYRKALSAYEIANHVDINRVN